MPLGSGMACRFHLLLHVLNALALAWNAAWFLFYGLISVRPFGQSLLVHLALHVGLRSDG